MAQADTKRVSLLGDARSGKLGANLSAFGRALRRAGMPVDATRIAMAHTALQLVGLDSRADVCAALEAVFVTREQDRDLFQEMFSAFFRDPGLAHQLLARMVPVKNSAPGARRHRPRVLQALAMPDIAARKQPPGARIELDAAMSASDMVRLKSADFNQLSASEYALAQRLVREIPLPMPVVPGRRTRPALRGAHLHWGHTLRAAARSGGELLSLHRWQRRRQALPLLVLLDVSGSMERYARTLLAFLHAATSRARAGGQMLPLRRDVFAFGTSLTDLNPAFRLADTDAMLQHAAGLIRDFGGGTMLGPSLAQLRRQHSRCLVGRRTIVLVVSDGLDTGEPDQLASELAWLRRHVRQILWLNPLLRFDGYQPSARGAAVLHRYSDGMLAVHNVTCLQELAAAIAGLLRKSHRQ